MIAAVHITKSRAWHGQGEEWENVYHYQTPLINTSDGWTALVNAIVAEEKKMHSSEISFVRARIHGPTDTGNKADDVMRHVQDLSGTGSMPAGALLFLEGAIVGKAYVGRSAKGYKRILRKYYHPGYVPTSAPTGASQGTVALGSTAKAVFKGPLDALRHLSIGPGECDICTEDGTLLPGGTGWEILDYVHTRQFKRGRKEKRPAQT